MIQINSLDKRQQITEVAQRFFYTKGYESTSVNDIIKAASVSKGGFYHHFDSKQAVMISVVASLAEQTRALIQPILDDPQLSTLEKLTRVIGTANSWKIEQRDQMLALGVVLYSDSNLHLRHQLMVETKRAILPIWTQILEQGVAEGVFDLGEIDEGHAAEFILDLLNDAGASFISHLLDPMSPADSMALMIAKYKSVEYAIQRILQAPAGSIHLIDAADIAAWFDQ